MRLLFLSVIGAAILPTGLIAASTCSEIMTAFRVEAPDHQMRFDDVLEASTFCGPDEMRMFKANYNAIEKAKPVTDPALLYGTWLGDDVYNYLTEKLTPGQEVMRIFAGEEKGTLEVEQLWMKPAGGKMGYPLWDENANYTGFISRGSLVATGELGEYSDSQFAPSFSYFPKQLEHSRSEDLFVKQSLNYFEFPVVLSISGDTLVLEYRIWGPLTPDTDVHRVTYTRVAPEAPETAMMLVNMLSVSAFWNFDCFAHQLSDRRGLLIEAFSPYQVEDVEKFVREFTVLDAQLAQTMVALRTSEGDKAELVAKMRVLTEKKEGIRLSDMYKFLTQISVGASGGQICPGW